ncbi:MAG: DUF5063 domain-containing protein [Polyangiaceae bacterium]
MRTREYSHPALTEFAALAAAFCETVVNVAYRTPEAQLDRIHRLLPQVYSAALQLPDTSVLCDDTDDSAVEREPDAAHSVIAPPPGLTELCELLGVRRFYREVFDPYADPSDAEVTGDIIDDLSDIYTDLQRGLGRWRSGAPGDALWEWRFNFQIHWAEHVTSALRALFALSAWRDVPWPTGAG